MPPKPFAGDLADIVDLYGPERMLLPHRNMRRILVGRAVDGPRACEHETSDGVQARLLKKERGRMDVHVNGRDRIVLRADDQCRHVNDTIDSMPLEHAIDERRVRDVALHEVEIPAQRVAD